MVDKRSGAGLGLLGVVATLAVGYLAIASDRGWPPFDSAAGAAVAPSLEPGTTSINHQQFQLNDGASIVFAGRNAPTMREASNSPGDIQYLANAHNLTGKQWTDLNASSFQSCLSSPPVANTFAVDKLALPHTACYSLGDQNAVAYVQINKVDRHQNGSIGVDVWIIARTASS
jgi:hypothetical protein